MKVTMFKNNPGKLWREKYPNHCTQCHGWGGRIEASDDPEEGNVLVCCKACFAENRCPRCGSPVHSISGTYVVCSNCGWNEDNPEGDPDYELEI